MNSYGDDQVRLFVSSIFRLHMAMIGRIDDTSKLLYEDLKGSKQHSSYSVLCKLWSKIVNDERDTPDQILIGLRTHLIVLSHEQYKFCVYKSNEKR